MDRFININYMRRTDKQVYTVVKESDTPLSLKSLALKADLSVRQLQRILSRLRKEKLIRGVKEGRYTVYEPIQRL